jgi:hypothetical protein
MNRAGSVNGPGVKWGRNPPHFVIGESSMSLWERFIKWLTYEGEIFYEEETDSWWLIWPDGKMRSSLNG